jgi:CspA family cold shock protein
LRHGTVKDLDEPKGFGTIEDEDGTTYFFHCTQIVDGTRTIAAGTAVWFEVVAGHMGRWEAASVTPGPATAPTPARPR